MYHFFDMKTNVAMVDCRSHRRYRHADKFPSLSCRRLTNLETGELVPSSCRLKKLICGCSSLWCIWAKLVMYSRSTRRKTSDVQSTSAVCLRYCNIFWVFKIWEQLQWSIQPQQLQQPGTAVKKCNNRNYMYISFRRVKGLI
jgi:hypothetical protein